MIPFWIALQCELGLVCEEYSSQMLSVKKCSLSQFKQALLDGIFAGTYKTCHLALIPALWRCFCIIVVDISDATKLCAMSSIKNTSPCCSASPSRSKRARKLSPSGVVYDLWTQNILFETDLSHWTMLWDTLKHQENQLSATLISSWQFYWQDGMSMPPIYCNCSLLEPSFVMFPQHFPT